MRLAVTIVAGAFVLVACDRSRADRPQARPQVDPVAAAETPVEEPDVAYFAGGCFWGVEYYLEQMDGVLGVESGYMGGHVDDPTYDDVSHQDSGHFEAVRVRYDAARVSYREVAKRFFEIHDPTQADGQGPDIGPEYRSAVFYTDEAQKRTTQELIGLLEARGYDVVTQLRAAGEFWKAEDFHQDYYVRHDKTPYCHARVKRFGD